MVMVEIIIIIIIILIGMAMLCIDCLRATCRTAATAWLIPARVTSAAVLRSEQCALLSTAIGKALLLAVFGTRTAARAPFLSPPFFWTAFLRPWRTAFPP